ncbi:hypothetical protein F9047_11445 [Escherichia coli]|nr:hypothetical protein F9047_11445 [Escherichia coli]
MNNYKSQGQTFEEVRSALADDVFVEDPFFKNHMENIRKQRELGLGFDMEKAKKVVEDAVSGIDYSDLPKDIRNRTLVIDIDQVCAAHGVETAEQREALKDKIANMPEVRDINLVCFDEVNAPKEEFVTFEILKGRSSTGRFDYPFLPDMHHMPRLNKTYMPPKDGDAFICMESEMDWSRLEELCKADLPRPDLHISGDDPALKVRKHPMIFKITDLVEEAQEMKRLQETLERNKEIEEMIGWPAPPMFIEAIPDANIVARAAADVMSQLTALARKYKVQIYFGTKPALKTALYSLMYGAKKEDLDMSQLDEISVEKAIEMYESKLRRVAIVGGGGISGMVKRIIADQHGLSVCVDSFDTWNFKDFANIAKLDKPARDWEQGRLRRGKGHNKFKRKGKK